MAPSKWGILHLSNGCYIVQAPTAPTKTDGHLPTHIRHDLPQPEITDLRDRAEAHMGLSGTPSADMGQLKHENKEPPLCRSSSSDALRYCRKESSRSLARIQTDGSKVGSRRLY